MKKISEKNNKSKIDKRSFDYLILLIFALSIILPIIIATSQYYITQYGDDIAMVSWAQEHHTNSLDIFTGKLGTGYRPMMHLWFFIGYNLWEGEPFYYHLLNGIVFSFAIVFLYLLGKLLYNKTAGLIAVLLYLFLDGSFIMIAKLGFIAFSGEILFILSGLYFSIKYFKTKDRNSMWLAIVLSTLAFMSKEPALLIIPFVNLTYLYFNGILKRNYIVMNVIPFIYMFVILFILSPDVGSEQGANLIERTISNLQFYLSTEVTSQFKTPILLVISLMIAGYYLFVNKMRDVIGLCFIWVVVGVLPFLITQQPVQPTYLIEANLGMVLLIGIIISDSLKKNNIILGLLVIGIIFQLLVVPTQIDNIRSYNNAISDNQKTFFNTVNALEMIPKNDTVFYFSENVRGKYGTQLTEDFFKKYLSIRNVKVNITTNYNDSNYVVLPSTLDVVVFQKEFPNERPQIIFHTNNTEQHGYILKR